MTETTKHAEVEPATVSHQSAQTEGRDPISIVKGAIAEVRADLAAPSAPAEVEGLMRRAHYILHYGGKVEDWIEIVERLSSALAERGYHPRDFRALDPDATATPTTARVSGTIKALEWRDGSISSGSVRMTAETAFGTYEVLQWSSDDFGGSIPAQDQYENNKDFGGMPSLAAAKAYAQADYNARVRSEIQPDPEPQPVYNARYAAQSNGGFATPTSAGMVSVEAAARVVSAYDRSHPMRTADQHRDGCGCLRCAVDALRALSEEGR